MTRTHSAHDCRWVEQTLDLPLPDWLDAWAAPWTCCRDPQPRRLLTTDECATCPRWDLSTPAARDSRPRTP
ncbi:MAG TPA: hypothetical protein VKH42_17555 [Vicinamibacterales bacterium]|nr:hypothetical protein [Vicinamibacterales bacterium]